MNVSASNHPTLTQFLVQHAVESSLQHVLLALEQACVHINHALRQGALAGILGSAEHENVQGETQKKLDIIANDMLIEALKKCPVVAGIASEEEDHFVETNAAGQFVVLFDPLDGSSNIDINMAVGTIFSILPRKSSINTPLQLSDFLQAGRHQVAAGYVLYGPSTLLVLTTHNTVDAFTLTQEKAFVLTAPQLRISAQTAEFAINASNQRHWEAPVQRYIGELLAGKTGTRGKDFNMRWVAAMVGDIHRILCRGGIFMYPYDTKDPKKAGRLRLMYEANPMSLLVERAGGSASTARMPILDVEPTDLHQRIPVILGSKEEVERVVEYHTSAPY